MPSLVLRVGIGALLGKPGNSPPPPPPGRNFAETDYVPTVAL